ncbi:MAG: TIGR03663 family protein, partial [Chloroflexota bacterium]|nr:TIGR03663 family protein [Chloroflexota bacterium]
MALYVRVQAALTVEVLIYVLFTAVAVGTRFWDLGSRPLHHDESLHAYFSWQYYVGRGYQHDPMMHGPLLFHLTRLGYHVSDLFFGVGKGDMNATARVMPAIFGALVVPMPFLLRRQLGRVSMLAASFLLLISPGLWYYGRFLRNEPWAVVFTLMSIIGIIRWMDSRNARWLHFAWVGWVLLFCSKEISFIVIFILVTFGTLVLGVAHARRALAALAVWPVGVIMGFVVLPGRLDWTKLPSIPFDNPSLQKSLAYAETMVTSPQVLTALGWTAVWLAAEAFLLWRADLPGQLRRIRQGAP